VEADDVQQVLTETAAGRGIDTRLAFARARPEAGGWNVESSDAGWLAATVARLEEAGVPARAGLVEAPADRVAWVLASVAEVRREPRHAAEQVTQVLQGEVLTPLLHEDGWMLVQAADGYVGWVRDWHLQAVSASTPEQFRARADARIDTACVALRAEPRRDADAVGETILGTWVATRGRDRAWAEIELPGGRTGWVPEATLRNDTAAWPATAQSILHMVRRFMGVPYLWGGRSPKGFDCSGLVQFVYGLHGIALPRDSDQQARAGLAVETPAAGDLIVFGRERVTHVAVAASATHFLHARGEVRCNAAVAGTPLYDAELWALRCGFRRVLGPAPSPTRG
jgi:cell wall-associated NlpC family hydrolase